MDEFVFGPNAAELLEVNSTFQSSLADWWIDLEGYLPRIEATSFGMVPVLVLNSYRYLGIERELSIKMANMFRTIFFATGIHELIRDDEEGQEHGQELQFSILIGDYIFGRVLKLLLESGTEELLDMFAAMICEINEGLIIKYKDRPGEEEILNLTRAPFYGYAFKSAAQLSRWSSSDQEKYAQLGMNLGMALELRSKEQLVPAGSYLAAARNLLAEMGEWAIPGRSELQGFMKDLELDLGGCHYGL